MSFTNILYRVWFEQGDVIPDTIYHVNFYYLADAPVEAFEVSEVIGPLIMPPLLQLIGSKLRAHFTITAPMLIEEDDPDVYFDSSYIGSSGTGWGFTMPSFAAVCVSRFAIDDGNHHLGRIFIPAPSSHVLLDTCAGNVDVEHDDIQAMCAAMLEAPTVGGVTLHPGRRIAATESVKPVSQCEPSRFLGVTTSRRYGRFGTV